MTEPVSAATAYDDRPAPARWPTTRTDWYPVAWFAAVCFVVFALVLWDIHADGLARQLDHVVADRIREIGFRENPVGNAVGFLLSQTGGRATNVAWVLVLCVVAVVQRRSWVPLARIAVAVTLMWAAVYPFKGGFSRSFPMDPEGDYFNAAVGGAYPSGHQANAVLLSAVGAWIAMDYIRQRWIRRVVCGYAIAAPVISAVAVLIMNYHWVTDVIGGACAGVVLLWLLRAAWGTPPMRRLDTMLERGPGPLRQR